MAQGSKLVIWWVPPPNEMALQERKEEVNALPDYIAAEVISLFGRSMRGRLWVSPELRPDFDDLEWNEGSPLSARALECGGVVVREIDIPTLHQMPGFITDRDLNLIRELN